MKLLYGLLSGAVLQRNHEEGCDIRFSAQVSGKLTTTLGAVSEVGDNLYALSAIPTGGPYTLTLRDDESEITLTDLYVGDVWLLGGQSNMEGYGYFKDVAALYHESEWIRCFRNNDSEWILAQPHCHENNLSPHPYMNRFYPVAPVFFNPRGVGPGYFFAEEMYRRTGVPQGLIPCALGGSCMAQWDPNTTDADGNLYTIAVERLKKAGGRIRGIFWHQGCSDTGAFELIDGYTEKMKTLVAAFRRDAENENLPFVQVQINRHTDSTLDSDLLWSAMRDKQRTLSDHIPYLDTVSSAGYTMADGIHLDGTSQRKLGISAAESMFHLCFDPSSVSSYLAPKLASVSLCTPPNLYARAVAIRFENLHGALKSEGAPWGFLLSGEENGDHYRHTFRIELSNDTVYLIHGLPDEMVKPLYLSYFFGNGAYANITDGAGRPLPAFGPIKISDLL